VSFGEPFFHDFVVKDLSVPARLVCDFVDEIHHAFLTQGDAGAGPSSVERRREPDGTVVAIVDRETEAGELLWWCCHRLRACVGGMVCCFAGGDAGFKCRCGCSSLLCSS